MVEQLKVKYLQLELEKLKTSIALNDDRESESDATETVPTRAGPSASVKTGIHELAITAFVHTALVPNMSSKILAKANTSRDSNDKYSKLCIRICIIKFKICAGRNSRKSKKVEWVSEIQVHVSEL